LEEHYIKPKDSTFFLAIHNKTESLIGTLGIRAYDRDFEIFRDVYGPGDTASICRVFVDKKWRRNGIASAMVNSAEIFSRDSGYSKMYLHTQKFVKGSIDFWLSVGYKIVEDTNNELGTVHMEKGLF